MQYSVKYSKRRTLALEIKKAQLLVRAPNGTPQGMIDQFIAQKKHWIEKHIEEQKHNLQKRSNPLSLGEGLLFGERLPITALKGSKSEISVDGAGIQITVGTRVKEPDAKQRQLLESLLKEQFEAYLKHKVAYYSEHMGIAFKDWKVRSYKRRWGSCNARKELSFNLFLVQAPHWVIDSVIIHELAHCRHLNHGPRFWQLVERFDANHQEASNWLKQHSAQLNWHFD